MRFSAPDNLSPFGSGGINSYAYCDHDPINRIDPSGHAWTGVEGALEAGAHNAAEHLSSDVASTESIAAHQAGAAFSTSPHGTGSANESNESLRNAVGKWREITSDRKHAVYTLSELLPGMGTPVETLKDFHTHFSSGRVVVQQSGTLDNVLMGHSAFFHNDRIYELRVARDEGVMDTQTYAARMPIRKAAFDRYRGITMTSSYVQEEDVRIRSYIPDGIHEKPFSRTSRIVDLIDKRRLYVLNPEYSEQFAKAFQLERISFKYGNHGYGLNYNCNTFVRNILKRLLDLSL